MNIDGKNEYRWRGRGIQRVDELSFVGCLLVVDTSV